MVRSLRPVTAHAHAHARTYGHVLKSQVTVSFLLLVVWAGLVQRCNQKTTHFNRDCHVYGFIRLSL